jgi:hypothetical protein
MSNPAELWRNMTDKQVRQALSKLNEYSPEGREAVLAEAALRGASLAENRYEDAYRASGSIVFFGSLVKVAGVIVGAGGTVLLLGRLPQSGGALVSLLVTAAVVMFLFWVVGVAIAAQGQILMASLDSAVHSSPFLNHAQRARVMSIAAVKE